MPVAFLYNRKRRPGEETSTVAVEAALLGVGFAMVSSWMALILKHRDGDVRGGTQADSCVGILAANVESNGVSSCNAFSIESTA